MLINPINKKKWFGLLLVLVSINLFSQNKKMDSLRMLIDTGKKDSIMVSNLNSLSIEVLNNEDIKESLIFSKKAFELSKTLDYKKGKAYALKNMGLAGYYQGDYASVFDYWTQSLQTFESIQDTLGIANMTSNLGVVYYDQGSHDKALEYYFKSLRISERLKDPVRITTALVNIGGVYSQMQDYDKALKFYQQIKKYLPKLNNPQIESTYLMGIGEVYSRRDDHNEAVNYYNQALLINKNTEDYAHNLTMLGIEEFKLGNLERSKSYLSLAYETSKELDSSLDELQTLLALGDVYQKVDASKSLEYYLKAEEIALEMETNEELRDIYKGMSQTYESNSDFKNAYNYHKKYLAQKDLLFNIETDDKIRGLQFDFDLDKKQDEISLLEKESVIQQLNDKRQKYIIYAAVGALVLIILMGIGLYKRYNYVKKTNRIIEEEKNRSENLLLNILPEETAHELKQFGKVKAKKFDSVTVLFTDFKGFTHYAHHLSPEDLVKSVDFYFSKFDKIMEKYGIEKIKTIGDAYMCAGGLPYPTKDHAFKMVQAAFEITKFIEESKKSANKNITHFDVRIGINTGPVVAGVVGIKKFAYDIWGDTVNVASRMETLSTPGRINISENTYKIIKDEFDCEYRGEIDVKNKGKMKMYFVNGLIPNKTKKITKVDQLEV